MIKNDTVYQPVLAFYKELWKEANNGVSERVKFKIAEKIIAYKKARSFKVFPQNEEIYKYDDERVVLAAASESFQSKSVSSTFLDEGKNVLIRVINTVNEKLIYVFSPNEQIIRNFKVILHPSNLVYSSEDNTKPIKIDSKIEIESITVELP